jgi:hypothetical protein
MEQEKENAGGEGSTFPFNVLNQRTTGRHMIVLGSTGAGRSRLAEGLGLTPEEMAELLKPTPEQVAEAKRRQAAEDAAATRRLQAVREAVWSTRCGGNPDLDVLHDVLTCLDVSDEPSEQQQKALFDLLPADVIGLAIAWGFSDTEVRDSIYTFAEENLQSVTDAVLNADGVDA